MFEVFKELYKIKSYLNNPNLRLKIFLIDMDEYRYVVEKKHARSSGYIREKQIPKSIHHIYDFNKKSDYIALLEELNLEENFVAFNGAVVYKNGKQILKKKLDKEIINRIIDFVKDKTTHLRIDTHEDNLVMQHVLEKNGFTKCGIIYLESGDPRLAYEKL